MHLIKQISSTKKGCNWRLSIKQKKGFRYLASVFETRVCSVLPKTLISVNQRDTMELAEFVLKPGLPPTPCIHLSFVRWHTSPHSLSRLPSL